jgi:anti-sigma factor RsiW
VIELMNQRDDTSFELISAYLDGELTPDECARVERLVACSDEYRQALQEMRTVVGGMKLLPIHHLDEAFPQRVVAAAREVGVAFDGDTQQNARPAPEHSSVIAWHGPAAVGLFATVAAAAVVAVLVWGPSKDPLTSASQQLISKATPEHRGVSTGHASRSLATFPDGAPLTEDHAKVADKSAAAAVAPEHTVTGEKSPTGRSGTTPDATNEVVRGEPVAPNSALSPPGPAAAMADPSEASSGTAASDLDSATVRLAGQPPLPGDDRLQKLAVADVPFSGTQQMLLVVDVALTRQGLEKGAFERTLADHDVAVEGTVPVDARLEESLLASRFFEPVKAEPENIATSRADLALLYVRTHAGDVDELWRAMQSDPSNFSSITLDMAFMADDQTMFQELRRAVDQQLVDESAVADVEHRARRAAAHRLALSPSWRGTPVTKLNGVKGLTGLVPDWMLGNDSGKETPIEGIAGQPVPKVPLPPGGRLGENIDAELFFVVHVGRIRQE